MNTLFIRRVWYFPMSHSNAHRLHIFWSGFPPTLLGGPFVQITTTSEYNYYESDYDYKGFVAPLSSDHRWFRRYRTA